ncbi:MAG: hypothetical protein ABFD81_20165 [Syntrophaceae bacterium]
MEAQSQVMWNFINLAYRRGLIDELMPLVGRLMDPAAELGDFLAQMEDALADADFSPFESLWNETMQPAIASLTNETAIDTLRSLLKILRPMLDIAAANRSALTRTLRDITELKPDLAALLPVLGVLSGSAVKQAMRGNTGVRIGSAVNSTCAALAKTHAREPELVERFFAGLLETIDPRLFRHTTDIILGGFLDQRPRVLGWTLGTLSARLKKRLIRSERRINL